MKYCSEGSLTRPYAASNNLPAEIAGLGHYELQAGPLHAVQQTLQLFDRRLSWHRIDYVLSCFLRFNIHPDMQRQWSKNSRRIHARMLQSLIEVFVFIRAAVNLNQTSMDLDGKIGLTTSDGSACSRYSSTASCGHGPASVLNEKAIPVAQPGIARTY